MTWHKSSRRIRREEYPDGYALHCVSAKCSGRIAEADRKPDVASEPCPSCGASTGVIKAVLHVPS